MWPSSPRGQEGVNNTLKYPVFRGEQRGRLQREKVGRERGDNAEQLSAVTFARCKAMWNDITLTSRPGDVPRADCKGGGKKKKAKSY